jgi:hypothetical protein
MADPDYVDTPMPASPPAPVHVPLSGPDGLSYTSEPQASAPSAPEGSSFGRVLSAFNRGFNESGPASGDFSPDTTDRLKRWTGFDTWPVFAQNAARAVNNVLVNPTAYDLSLAWHAMSGLLPGAQAAVAQTGEELEGTSVGRFVGTKKLGRDIAAIPEAFPSFEFRMGAPSRAVTEAERARELRLLESGSRPAELAEGGAASQTARATEASAPVEREGVAEPQSAARVATELPRSIEEQRAFIHDDVAQQLVRAGRPEQEAQDIGALEATHYVEWSRWFRGGLGTPEELYRREAAEILGHGMRSEQAGIPETGILPPDLEGRVTGMLERFRSYRPVLTAFREADPATIIHEKGHEWLEQLFQYAKHEAAPEDFRATAGQAREWLGMAPDQERPTLGQHEKFARGFEQYLREGKAPSPEMAGIFERFKQHLVAIYQTIRDLGKPINEDARQVFDRMLAEKPQREPGGISADLHEGEEWWRTDPAYVEPSEAEAILDHLAEQQKRHLDELPDDIRAKLEAELYRLHRAAVLGLQ